MIKGALGFNMRRSKARLKLSRVPRITIRPIEMLQINAHAQVIKADTVESYDRLTMNKKAKAEIVCNVYSGSQIAAVFTGTYVVIPKKDS